MEFSKQCERGPLASCHHSHHDTMTTGGRPRSPTEKRGRNSGRRLAHAAGTRHVITRRLLTIRRSTGTSFPSGVTTASRSGASRPAATVAALEVCPEKTNRAGPQRLPGSVRFGYTQANWRERSGTRATGAVPVRSGPAHHDTVRRATRPRPAAIRRPGSDGP